MMSFIVAPSSAKLGEDLHELLSVFCFLDWKLKDKPSTWAMPSDSRAPKQPVQPSDPHLDQGAWWGSHSSSDLKGSSSKLKRSFCAKRHLAKDWRKGKQVWFSYLRFCSIHFYHMRSPFQNETQWRTILQWEIQDPKIEVLYICTISSYIFAFELLADYHRSPRSGRASPKKWARWSHGHLMLGWLLPTNHH